MKPNDSDELKAETPIAPPPIMGTWPRLYAFVLLSQVVFVVLLWILSESV